MTKSRASGTHRRLRSSLAPLAAALLVLPANADVALAAPGSRQPPTADRPPDCASRIAAPPPAGRVWPAPLDRVVQLRTDDATLREALARIAREARVRFSYSPELIPLDRPACVAAGDAALGDALVVLLAGTGIAPVVAGTDQVVLAPTRAAAAADAPPEYARTTSRLERVVVTGTATGAPERETPFALTVIDAGSGALARSGTQSLGQLLDGAVPGMWMWTQSPTSALARYGSVRGASSFGVSAPKVYVDGIEMANPLLLTTLDPSRVQRVEVIRGPQGAALYGADAIGGVVNVVTRQEGVGASTPAAELRASAGTSASAFASAPVLAQDYGAVLRSGSAARSASLGVTVSTLGAFVPGADARQLGASASARRVGARSVVTATAQFHGSNAEPSVSPLLAGLQTSADSGARQSVRQYTVGTTVTLLGSDRWTHALVAGLDVYRLAGVSTDGIPVSSPTDSALRTARGGADRATLRLSSTARFGAGEARSGALTFAAEHSTAREQSNGEAGALLMPRDPRYGSGDTTGGPTPPDSTAPYDRDAHAGGTTWWSNTGVLAQGQLALANALFLNGGARVEYISVPEYRSQVALLPMLGASWLRERGPLALKLRAAYGRGIRPARTVARGATWTGGSAERVLTSLAPEEQSGIETGADLLWGDHAGFHVTRFDQRASGLVQPVALIDSGGGSGTSGGGPGPGGDGDDYRVAYQLQNVGAIDNRGWELQATSSAGPLSLAATLSLVSSRVHRVASGYSGDLRPGDRMLEVPARTLGLSATWTSGRWSASSSVARASDWVNYDLLALARAIATARAAGTSPDYYPVGPRLRDFWRTYDGVTHVNARASLLLGRGMWLTLTGDNLLNRQLGEPDNVTVLPGRTVTAGVRAGF